VGLGLFDAEGGKGWSNGFIVQPLIFSGPLLLHPLQHLTEATLGAELDFCGVLLDGQTVASLLEVQPDRLCFVPNLFGFVEGASFGQCLASLRNQGYFSRLHDSRCNSEYRVHTSYPSFGRIRARVRQTPSTPEGAGDGPPALTGG